ncbi:hypothetical protein PTKIN_Ptkin10aG0039500 [Pterospermum kingtungense]
MGILLVEFHRCVVSCWFKRPIFWQVVLKYRLLSLRVGSFRLEAEDPSRSVSGSDLPLADVFKTDTPNVVPAHNILITIGKSLR